MTTADTEARRRHRIQAEAIAYALRIDDPPERATVARREAAETAMALLEAAYPRLDKLVQAAEVAAVAAGAWQELIAAGGTKRAVAIAGQRAEEAATALSRAWEAVEVDGTSVRKLLEVYERLATAAGADGQG